MSKLAMRINLIATSTERQSLRRVVQSLLEHAECAKAHCSDEDDALWAQLVTALEREARDIEPKPKAKRKKELSLAPRWFGVWPAPNGLTVCECCMTAKEKREAGEDYVECWHVGESGFTMAVHCDRCGYEVAQKDEGVDE